VFGKAIMETIILVNGTKIKPMVMVFMNLSGWKKDAEL
jgi:hypothetical protein